MPLEGHIVEFADTDSLKFAFVRKHEYDRVHAVDPRGREIRLAAGRIAIVHHTVSEPEFPQAVRDLDARIESRRRNIDVELLWQVSCGSRSEIPAATLAELSLGDGNSESQSAVVRALYLDTLFFKRNGTAFLPRTEEQVRTEQNRRNRELENERNRTRSVEILTRLLQREQPPEGADAALDHLLDWLLGRGQEETGLLLSGITGAGVARERAFDILQRSGRIPPDADRFLLLAGIDPRFTSEAEALATSIPPYEHNQDRNDFRDLPAFSIDDEDTTEIDDAITVRRAGSHTLVSVHIADVSEFVKPGDALDLEARRRSSTIYLPTAVVPMLPDVLSMGTASLNQSGDKPVLTVELRFDPAHRLIDFRVLAATIRIHERLTYEAADERIAAGDDTLDLLERIALTRRDERSERGALHLRRSEVKIRAPKNGNPAVTVKVLPPDSRSRLIVSEFMVLLNGLVADYAAVRGLPVIYRAQEPREPIHIDVSRLHPVLAFDKTRRTFKRSRLSLSPGTHSGLGLDAYTQASSPLRRYADLVIQRQIAASLRGQVPPHSKEELLQVLSHAETREHQIRQIEERANLYWLIRYIEQSANASWDAVGIDSSGTVEVLNLGVRGKLNGTSAPGEVMQVRLAAATPERGEVRFSRA